MLETRLTLKQKIAWTSSELTYNMQSIWTFILQHVWFQNRSMNLLSIQSSFSLIDYTFIVELVDIFNGTQFFFFIL